MNIEQSLISDRSKGNVQSLADYIVSNPIALPELVQLLNTDNTSESQYRAAWVLGYLAPIGIQALEPHLDFLLQLLRTERLHPTIPRSITRLFQFITLPEIYHGRLIDSCFNILASEEHLSAQRANSMTILHRYTKIYPEIGQELLLVISEILEYKNDPALQSRGKKILKTLKKAS